MSLVDGDSLTSVEWGGEITVFWGFVMLVALGVSAPPLLGFSVMTLAGISWGFYTLAGKHPADAVAGTTFNFIKAVPVWLCFYLCLTIGRGRHLGCYCLHYQAL